MEIVLSSILDMMHSRFHDVLDIHNPKKEIDSHKKIISAIRERDAETAKQLMFQHIQDTMDMLPVASV